jgi:TRAP-type mannitol/chloroaromatic compound transport system permease small subunit
MEEFIHAFSLSELSETNRLVPFRFGLMKLAVPVSFLLLMIQGISELIKAWYLARTAA